MKYIITSIFILTIAIGCNNVDVKEKSNLDVENDSVQSTTTVNFNFQSLQEFAMNYQPNKIDLSKDINDTLQYFDLKKIYAQQNSDSLLNISRIILLKLNLYHLKRTNQGYNLYMMRNGGAKTLIDYYLLKNNVDTIGEFFATSHIAEIESKREAGSPLINKLLQNILKEEKRIEKEMNAAVEKYDKK